MPEKSNGRFHWTALKFVFLISLVFLVQLVFSQNLEAFVLKSSEVLYRPWTLLTYIFLHVSFSHLYSNMFSLAIFGSILEKVVGNKNFLKVFFSTGIFSGVSSIFFYDSVIGASGSAFGVMGVLAVLRPKLVVWAVGVPMYMMVAIVVYIALDLMGVFYPSNIAHIGHISASVLGILIGFMWRRKYQVVEPKREKFVLDKEEFSRWEEEYMKKRK